MSHCQIHLLLCPAKHFLFLWLNRRPSNSGSHTLYRACCTFTSILIRFFHTCVYTGHQEKKMFFLQVVYFRTIYKEFNHLRSGKSRTLTCATNYTKSWNIHIVSRFLCSCITNIYSMRSKCLCNISILAM